MTRGREIAGIVAAALLGLAVGLGGAASGGPEAPQLHIPAWKEVAAGLPPLDRARGSEYGYDTYKDCLDRLIRIHALAEAGAQARKATAHGVVWFAALPLGVIGLIVTMIRLMPSGERAGTL